MKISKLPKAVKDHARDDFVGNECGTDEYRETQPWKGFTFIADVLDDGGTMLWEDQLALLKEVRAWLDAIITTTENPNAEPWEHAYAGAQELEPVLTRIFNHCWQNNYHPYDYTAEELLERYKEDQ
jgi:hypothetical protein